jgi:hypothetical protein
MANRDDFTPPDVDEIETPEAFAYFFEVHQVSNSKRTSTVTIEDDVLVLRRQSRVLIS